MYVTNQEADLLLATLKLLGNMVQHLKRRVGITVLAEHVISVLGLEKHTFREVIRRAVPCSKLAYLNLEEFLVAIMILLD